MSDEQAFHAVEQVGPTPPAACQQCGKPGPLKIWLGESGALGYVHGIYKWWCDRCVLEGQIKYIQQVSERLPEIKAALAALDGTPIPAPAPGWPQVPIANNLVVPLPEALLRAMFDRDGDEPGQLEEITRLLTVYWPQPKA